MDFINSIPIWINDNKLITFVCILILFVWISNMFTTKERMTSDAELSVPHTDINILGAQKLLFSEQNIKPDNFVPPKKYFNKQETVVGFNCLPETLDGRYTRCHRKSNVSLLTNEAFDADTLLTKFDKEDDSVKDKLQSCTDQAKQACRIRSLSSSDCYKQQYRSTPLQQFTRSGELTEGYMQRTNNQMSSLKCDCSNRTFDSCNEVDKVSEACMANAKIACLKQ